MKQEQHFWSDGTPKSQGNAFTAHGYVRGAPILPTPARPRHVKGGFGAKNGTIAGMGRSQPTVFNGCLRKKTA